MKKNLLSLLGCSVALALVVSSTGIAAESASRRIVWAQGYSGNVLVTIAKEKGYFDEVGVEVVEIPLDENQLEAVRTGLVDIASNSGTTKPIQMIAAGDDMAIIGGFMLTGCMPVIARSNQKWETPDDFLGSKIADMNGKSRYPLYHTLLEGGHDLDKDVIFEDYGSDGEKIQAVLKGEVDYAVIGTSGMYAVLNTDGIKIVTYCSDVTPNYSCCRMVARNSWVKENRETVKLLNEALIRAQCYFESHRNDYVERMAKYLRADTDYVAAYLLNEHYRINPDTVKNIVMDNYNYMVKVGGIEDYNPDIKLEDYVYSDIYKEALLEATEKWGAEDPEFYKEAMNFYKANNE